jgi:hypothetical protein
MTLVASQHSVEFSFQRKQISQKKQEKHLDPPPESLIVAFSTAVKRRMRDNPQHLVLFVSGSWKRIEVVLVA